MTVDFTMPKLGHMMEEGTVVAWHKEVGDRISKGDVLVEIETEKLVLEVESFDDGVLLKILVEPGETVPVGAPLAQLGDTGGD